MTISTRRGSPLFRPVVVMSITWLRVSAWRRRSSIGWVTAMPSFIDVSATGRWPHLEIAGRGQSPIAWIYSSRTCARDRLRPVRERAALATPQAPREDVRPTALRLEGVSKRYRRVLSADGVTLAIAEAEFFPLLGPSGSCKTSILRLIT